MIINNPTQMSFFNEGCTHFDKRIIIHPLHEGDVINPTEYVKSLEQLGVYGLSGLYIIEKQYKPYNETGFHWYFVGTLISYFGNFAERGIKELTIKFNKGKLAC